MQGDSALSDLCELIADCPHSTPKWMDAGVPVLRSHNIRSGRLDLSDLSFTDEEHYKQRSRRVELKSGDLVITREAPMGEVCRIPENLRCCMGQRMVLLRPDLSRCDGRFLLYAIQSPAVQRQISWSEGTGSTVSNLRIPHLKALRIPTPTLAEQRSIAATLGVLDDKIEQNHCTSQTLEELARATFKAWFVDFEPVKAKAAGQSSFPGMLADTFAALPDRFADSPLGLVPEGWEATALSATCQIVSGGTPKRSISDYWGGDIPWYSVKDAPEDGMPWVQITGETITQAGLQGSAATLVPVGATIISARGTVGRLALAAQPMAFNQSCYGLLPIDGKSFCHLHLLLQHVVRKLKKMTHGSVFETITKQTFDSVSVIQALAPVIESFEQIVAPLFALQLASLKESAKLAELRDYLLPRLLSGQVRVNPGKTEAQL
ncbi:restriction endonuclease subunit S [Xanthomonas campestris pv. paulliniae]|uniref:restriction endonuclease subunit S n=1 Tax=Xanthomonas euvesicatoria TaxID=456327 RepID=UPI001C43F65F|nr:restriction endonuclease subunit S [Xanthomonas euvesicatoria]MBV6847414.1 restriction endonuclease subunit S [Xanthomonas campestris pv. paulliniae]